MERNPHRIPGQRSELHRSLWRVCFALLALVAVCLICANLTTAWYPSNTADTSDEITSAAAELSMGDYTIYYYPSRSETQSCVSTGNSDSVSMMSCDTLLDSRNDKTAVLLVVPISGEAIKQEEAASFSIVLSRSQTQANVAYLSDYVTVRCAVGQQGLVVADDAKTTNENINTTYDNIKSYLEKTKQTDTGEEDVFPSTTFGTENSITFSISGYDDYVSGDTVYVYMEIDYNSDAVKEYVSGKSVTIKFGQENQLQKFEADISDIAVVPAGSAT